MPLNTGASEASAGSHGGGAPWVSRGWAPRNNKEKLTLGRELPRGSKNPNARMSKWVKVVEAAGFAPASENTSPQEYYDAYPLLSCRPRREEAAKNRRGPAPENLITGV